MDNSTMVTYFIVAVVTYLIVKTGFLQNLMFYLTLPGNRTIYESEQTIYTFRPDPAIMQGKRATQQYVIDLQSCYLDMVQKLGDDCLIDRENLSEEYFSKVKENATLTYENARLTAENEALREKIQSALQWQTSNGLKHQVFTENGFPPPENKPGVNRNSSSNKFESADGVSGKEKEAKAYYWKMYGYSDEEIAETLGVKVTSIPVYVSKAKKGSRIIKTVDGAQYLRFDDSYGGMQWSLDEEEEV